MGAQCRPPLRLFGESSVRFVGVDAHIDPAVCTIFTELFGEFVRAQRGDVGIAPYAGWGWLNKPYFGASIFLGNCV